jgi:hypothetical protein
LSFYLAPPQTSTVSQSSVLSSSVCYRIILLRVGVSGWVSDPHGHARGTLPVGWFVMLIRPPPWSSRACMMISRGFKPFWTQKTQLKSVKIVCRFWCSAKPESICLCFFQLQQIESNCF